MTNTRWWGWVLLAGCGAGGDANAPDDGAPTVGDDDTDVVPIVDSEDTALPTGTESTEHSGCFADVVVDAGDDGMVLHTGGIDVYDPVRTDLVVFVERWVTQYYLFAADYTYDADGNVVRVGVDQPRVDGVDDLVSTYTWNGDGSLASFAEDRDADGDPDFGYTTIYDAGGLLVSAVYDQDGDELPDLWFTYTYDDLGRVTRIEGDLGNDGTVDSLETTTYTDPVLRVGTTVVDDDNDGVADFTETFVYDADERLLLSDQERFSPPPNDDFVDVTHQEFTYDDQGRLVDQLTDGQYNDGAQSYSRLSRTLYMFGGTCP